VCHNKLFLEGKCSFIVGAFNPLFNADSAETIFQFPKDAFNDDFSVGYTLKKDSVSDCTPVYIELFE